MHKPIKIGFILLSNTSNVIPSTRIVVLNMLPYLRAAQFDAHIIFDPDSPSATPDVSGLAARIKSQGFDIIFFQKVFGESVLSLVDDLRVLGIKTVFSVCDYVNPQMCAATDVTIVVTDHLKEQYPKELHSKIVVVHDGIECLELCKTEWGTRTGSRANPLNAILVTSAALGKLPLLVSPPSWLKVTIVGRYSPLNTPYQRIRENWWHMSTLNGIPARLKYFDFLLNSRIKCVAWGASSVYKDMQRADIGIIPIEVDKTLDPNDSWRLKSENRLTLKMSMGLPVIATPIPAYEPVIVQGENGFLANDSAQWLKYLNILRDPEQRKSIGQQARKTAITRYSMNLQAEKLITVLRSLLV